MVKNRLFIKGVVVFLTYLPLVAELAKLPAASGNGILIDAVHCNDYSDIGLQKDNFEYHQISGYRFGFDYLKHRGVPCERMLEGRLSDEVLAKHKVLMINLVSADKSPFLVSEINAIVKFVSEGGGLMVITDHTNCYFHSHILEPLFTEFGIESTRDTACDRFGNTLSAGNGWLKISRFEKHPVTDRLRFLGTQTGGTVDKRFAVAFTSEDAWPDNWICTPYFHGMTPGFYGNFVQDLDEPTGKLGVVLAKEHGKGRIVIVADQNIFADTFLNYADNYKLWLNAFSWLLEHESLNDSEAYVEWKSPHIWAVEDFARVEFGSDSNFGMNNAWNVLNRHFWTFASDRIPSKTDCDLAVIVDGYVVLPEETVADLAAHLRQGKNVLALHTTTESLESEGSVIYELLDTCKVESPKFEKSGDAETLTLSGGGKLILYGGETQFTNNPMPSASSKPNEDEQNVAETLKTIVEQAKSSKPQTE